MTRTATASAAGQRELLFVIDPPGALKPAKDSSIAMMRELARRGHAIWVCTPQALTWDNGAVRGLVLPIRLEAPNTTEAAAWFTAAGPAALRNHNEKLAITEFTAFIAPTLVTGDAAEILAFQRDQGEIVVKPLDGMGGSGVFRLSPGDPNTNAILEAVTLEGGRTVMAQRFLPAIAQGDKRILLIGGRPVPYALARVPKAGESRGNLAAGGTGHARALTERDREIAEALGPVLDARGLLLVGLDVIGDHLTEINVTSPTCFVEITQQSGFDVAAAFVDALLARLDA